MLLSRRPLPIGLALVAFASPGTVAAAPASVPVQRPSNAVPGGNASPSATPPEAPQSTAPAGTSTPATADGAIAPPQPATAPVADPASAPSPPAQAPAEPGGAQTPGLAEQLLGPSVNQHPERRPTAPVPTESDAAAAEDAAMAAMYRDLYRPRHNPGRFHIVARANFGFGSSFDGTLSGRTGGAQVDVGQSFNFIGYAATLRAEGGVIDFGPTGRSQMTGLIGGGPTLSLGRLGMLQRGYIDLRIGYDFFFAPARERTLEGPVLAVRLPAELPHGPRAQLNLGLLISSDRDRRLFHGVGVGIGYQVLVGSFRGDLPPSQFLQLGLHYSGG